MMFELHEQLYDPHADLYSGGYESTSHTPVEGKKEESQRISNRIES